jgi:membrane protease YdiL (CAAX protease family)
MTSAPPPYEHPGSPPPRPELPEGVWRPDPPAAPAATGDGPLPGWPLWAPFAGMLGTLILAVVGVGLIAIVAEAFGTSVSSGDSPPGVVIGGTYLQDLALIASAFVLARLLDPPARAAQFGLRPTAVGPAIGWTLLAWGGFFAFSAIWSVVLNISDSDDLPDELGADSSDVALVFVALLVCVMAPIAEELFFRGFTFTALRRRLGMLPAAVVTGMIFGAIHLGGTQVEFIVPLMVFGFFLCLLYVWTDSLLPCIVLHALNNSLALGVSQDWGAATLAGMVGAAGLCLLITLPVARRSRMVPT